MEAGIRKHKCATIAEAEMVASCGAPDVLIAYPLVGPNCVRLTRLIRAYPQCRFSVLADHPAGIMAMSEAMQTQLEPVFKLRAMLVEKGLPIPRFVAGGTPTFPIHAHLDVAGLECSPGTLVLHDHAYSSRFPDLAGFTPAALLLTRVISRPTPTRLTLDLGYKAVSSDPPAGKRCLLLDVPDYQPMLQNEEHFVVETLAAERYRPGDEIFAIPTHVCPTVALHRSAYVIENGQIAGRWEIAARDRVLNL